MSTTPRAIDVSKLAEARIREILSIHDQIKSSGPEEYGIHGLPRGLRRRSRSHKRYRRCGKRPNIKKGKISGEIFLNRRMRRKKEFQKNLNPWEDSESSSGDICRLPTHVFHAKRMAMAKIEGCNFVVPEGDYGCGRGTRSFKYRLENLCIVHDASYWCSIELIGSMEAIMPILSHLSNYFSTQCLVRQSSLRQLTDQAQSNFKWSIGPLDIVCGNDRIIVWAHCEYARQVICKVYDIAQGLDVAKKLGRLGRIEVRGPLSENVLNKLAKVDYRGISLADEVHHDAGLDENCVWSTYDKIKKKHVTYSASLDPLNCLTKIAFCLRNFCAWKECHSQYTDSDDFIDICVIKNESGFSICLNRELYPAIFKAIALSGVFVAGQREWHWYHTLNRVAFYPDDYPNSSRFCKAIQKISAGLDTMAFPSSLIGYTQKFSSRAETFSRVYVWITKNGTLKQGDTLCFIESDKLSPCQGKLRVDAQSSIIRKSDSIVATAKDIYRWDVTGMVTSARPHAMNAECPSIGLMIKSSLIALGKKKIKLWAWSPDRGLIVPVTVKTMS